MNREEFSNRFVSEKDSHGELVERTKAKLDDAAKNGINESNTLDEDEAGVSIEAMFGRQEELHPDLLPWTYESPTLGTCIKHPFIFSIMHIDALNATINHGYKQKQHMYREHKAKREFSAVIFAVYERAYRLYGFAEIAGDLDDEEYWELLGAMWTDSENIHENEQQWMEFLSDERPMQDRMMEEEERAALAAMPETLTVYRGFEVEERHEGLSWTLDKAKAVWFAKRLHIPDHGHTPRVATATVQKTDVIAHFTGRGESEIVAMPEDVNVEKIEEVEL